MASSIITSIDSILTSMTGSFEYSFEEPGTSLGLGLKSLKVFLLCTRRLGDDANLRSASFESLLSTIQDVMGRILKQFQEFDNEYLSKDLRRRILKYFPESDIEDVGDELCWRILPEICSLVEETYEWYTINMPNHWDPSTSLTCEEIVSIAYSISLILEQFRSFQDQMHPSEVYIIFWKDFLLFTMHTSLETHQLQNLFIHFGEVALHFALAFLRHGDITDEFLLQLIKKIKPIDPQVCAVYIQALSSSRLYRPLHTPTEDMDDETLLQLNNFLGSLIPALWDSLQPDPCRLDYMKGPLQMLYEGLRFSRTILKQRPQSLDAKIVHQIGYFVCAASIFICSSQHTIHSEIHPDLPEFLERIKVIQAEWEKTTPQTSAFDHSSTTTELSYVDSVFESLMELTNRNGQLIAEILPQTMQEELVFLRSFLKKPPMDLQNTDQELQALRNRAFKVAYRVEFLIDRLVVGDTSNSFSNFFDSIMEDIRGINTEVKKMSFGKATGIKVEIMMGTSSHQLSQMTPSMTTEAVGFQDEVTSIVNRLTRGSKQLRVVPISGMGGSGKTTLALKVFNDPSVTHHFNVRAWYPVSQVLDKKKVVHGLLNQIDHGRSSLEMTEDDLARNLRREMTEDDLAQNLWRALKGKRYLIFLDDVWTTEAWNSLKGSFPNDSTESRIILTSRHRSIVPPDIRDQEPHLLRPLDDQESLTLLGMKLFPGKGWPPTLNELGKQIVDKCKGLPLTIVILAGLLANMEQESWKGIADAFSSSIVSSTELCLNILELSYKHLPDYLIPCLLYFGSFPEDEEIHPKILIRIWIAEGFVRKTNSKSTEDVAGEYMAELVERSLIMVSDHRSIGGVKAFRVHDLIRDFCVERAKQVSFLHLLQGHDPVSDFYEPSYLRRLFIYISESDDLRESNLFCPRARSLQLFCPHYFDSSINLSSIIQKLKLLKVLVVEPGIRELPSEIVSLIQLKFLLLRVDVESIPSWIGNLLNLETLIVNSRKVVLLPFSIFSLQKLKYLLVGSYCYFEDFESSPTLFGLETFGTFLSSDLKKDMRKFLNIRRLKLRLRKDQKTIVFPDFLNQLESLSIKGYSKFLYSGSKSFCLPKNLKKLTLSALNLSTREISIIGKLPNLQVLKLGYKSILGNALEMQGGGFSELRYLKLDSLRIAKWTADDDQLPYLQKLVLDYCQKLEEIPDCLQIIPTLEEIFVHHCDAVKSSVKNIQTIQAEYNNMVKIYIT